MAFQPLNSNGQATMANSSPVVLASNQTSIPVAATLSAETTKVIGTVNQGTSPWVISGTVTANAGTNLNTSLLALESGGNLASIKTDVDNLNLAQASTTSGQKGNLVLAAVTTAAPSYTTAQSNPLSLDTSGNLRIAGAVTIAANSSVNVAQVAGTATSVGNGTTDAGTTRVTLSSDSTGQVKIAAGSAVIGHVITDTGSTTAVTGNVTVVQTTGTNLHVVTDSTSTTAVTQATAANLNATVVGTGTFATQSAITAASGSIASGAIASGAIASGAVASGAFAAGSIAAGAVAAGATSFVKLEDVASADADAGVPAMAIRKASPANTSGTDGDYEMLQVSAGRLWASANIDQINSVTPLMGNGVTGTGSLRVTIASDNTANSNPFLVTQIPATSGGLSIASGTIGNAATSIKGSAGQVYGWYFYNANATVAYVQFYNVASGSVTPGTTGPTFSIGIPATSGANVHFNSGILFGTAITIAITTTRSGGTSPGSTVDYNIFYK